MPSVPTVSGKTIEPVHSGHRPLLSALPILHRGQRMPAPDRVGVGSCNVKPPGDFGASSETSTGGGFEGVAAANAALIFASPLSGVSGFFASSSVGDRGVFFKLIAYGFASSFGSAFLFSRLSSVTELPDFLSVTPNGMAADEATAGSKLQRFNRIGRSTFRGFD